ncbi:hypothetical protein [Brachyspira sp. G79]|uniref:hypothetical protein n=1 Tax=Brachyspira sp. G79 TaxID=1358104 RepID=UPI000BBCD886|nr:hypothetical protein [Brachyspira sp. G79]PCG18753.1 hypothetical protein KQ44_13555 [Brachyspira sp. G79]
MKKILQIALVLTALALFSTACSKVRTTNLIGTYKSGSSTMSVTADGTVGFSIASDATGVLASLNNVYGGLVPWDLTSEKQSYDYSFETEKYEYPSTGGQPTYYKVNVSFNFTKDNETVNCKVSITVPEGKGESGSVTFSK